MVCNSEGKGSGSIEDISDSECSEATIAVTEISKPK